MDSYSLKKDNRKKFQDKQKLKRKHATPSDKKYNKINAKPIEEDTTNIKKPLPSNDKRYLEDTQLAFETDEEEPEQVKLITDKLKEIIIQRQEKEDSIQDDSAPSSCPTHLGKSAATITKRQLDHMDVGQLNSLLSKHRRSAEQQQDNEDSLPTQAKLEHVVPLQQPQQQRLRPLELEEDENFLDGLI